MALRPGWWAPTAALAMLALAPAVAHASTLVVNTTTDEVHSNDGLCSLREAIDSVNTPATPSPDCTKPDATNNTIMLGAGDYLLTIKPGGSDDNTTGDLNVAANISGVTIEGLGPTSTTIDATGLTDRVLSIGTGASVTLEGLTLS